MWKMQHTLIVLWLNIFQRKLEKSWEITILKQVFIEHKHKIQQGLDIFVLDSLILC